MAKKKTDYSQWHSFYEDGQKYLQCWSCLKHFPVDDNCGKFTCSRCGVIRSVAMFPETLPKNYIQKKTGRPPGWHFMNEFVDKDGNVFHKGKEQPDLKGTLPPTKVTPVKRKKKKKLTEDEKMFKRAAEHKKKLKIKRKSNK